MFTLFNKVLGLGLRGSSLNALKEFFKEMFVVYSLLGGFALTAVLLMKFIEIV